MEWELGTCACKVTLTDSKLCEASHPGAVMTEASTKSSSSQNGSQLPSRRAELLVFSVIAALIWPVVAVGVVGGYGFVIWMYQIVFGPPGPPH